jgi:multidrug efflux pump subunit AcrA (membrane-fusion protein)
MSELPMIVPDPDLPTEVTTYQVGPRDGLQNEAALVPVEDGQVLGMMEAMKMELSLTAPFAGTVTAVDVVAGQQVALGATLFVVEPVGGAE